MNKEALHKLIKQEIHEHMLGEGITNWLIDKVSNGFKWYVNKRADYQYDALLNDKKFRSMAKSMGYKSEDEFVKKAKSMIQKDPNKFAKILAYDVKNSDLRKHGII